MTWSLVYLILGLGETGGAACFFMIGAPSDIKVDSAGFSVGVELSNADLRLTAAIAADGGVGATAVSGPPNKIVSSSSMLSERDARTSVLRDFDSFLYRFLFRSR